MSGSVADEWSAIMIPLFSRRVNPAGESSGPLAADRMRWPGCFVTVTAPWHRIGPALWGHDESPVLGPDNPEP